jgi:hypothetical protein
VKSFKQFITEEITMGININDKRAGWTDLILSGKKTIETRDTNSLKPYVGKRVALIQTGKGKAKIVGVATIGEPIQYNSVDDFKADVNRHRVSSDGFDQVKFGYPLKDVQKLTTPIEVNSRGIVARNVKGLI